MKILFTGATSFTGFWFVEELSKAGHEITLTLQHSLASYTGLKKSRLEQLTLLKHVFIEDCSFGTERFMDLIQSDQWDVLCHHAAEVTNYKSLDFDFYDALQNNTRNLHAVVKALKTQKCPRLVLTGSVFEQNEGLGNVPLKAFSPYGLSKGLTADVFEYFCASAAIEFSKFVIPNPFGPYEEPRFTNYLIQQWIEGKEATVSSPDYIRDNIHVSVLAKAYVHYIENSKAPKFAPSGYVESQGAFAQRFANEMRQRLNLPCSLKMLKQEDFPEPITRINSDSLHLLKLDWQENAAWNGLANYYQNLYQLSMR